MYIPTHFSVGDGSMEAGAELLTALITSQRVGTLSSVIDGRIQATVLPLLIRTEPVLSIVGHLAAANVQSKTIGETDEALISLQGPDAYVSPSFYATKAETEKVVPTWNYSAVHAYGQLVLHYDAAWKLEVVQALTNAHEAHRDNPWSVDDAPEPYIQARLKGIVGVELIVSELQAKEKLSQDKPATDRQGVVSGLGEGSSADRAVGERVADRLNQS